MTAAEPADVEAAAPLDGTAGAVVSFLDFTIEKGYLKAATARAMKVAVREVLAAVEGENWDKTPVQDLDLADAVRRFETLRAMKYKQQSLHTYGQRFTSAVTMYLDFTANPKSWQPTVRSRASRGPRPANTTASTAIASPKETPGSQVKAAVPEARAMEPSPSRPPLIPYPFPLRDGSIVTLHLPVDLSRREANRLVAFIQSLAVDDALDGMGSSHDG